MAAAKTMPTGRSLKAHLDALEDESCGKARKELAVTTKRVTGCELYGVCGIPSHRPESPATSPGSPRVHNPGE